MTTTTMVPVTDLLRNITESYDGYALATDDGWTAMLREKSADSSFWYLIDAIPTEGFLYPIRVVVKDTGWVQGNGHHRLCAAILLGLDEVPVVFGDGAEVHHDEFWCDGSDECCCEADYMLTDVTAPDEGDMRYYDSMDTVAYNTLLGLLPA